MKNNKSVITILKNKVHMFLYLNLKKKKINNVLLLN